MEQQSTASPIASPPGTVKRALSIRSASSASSLDGFTEVVEFMASVPRPGGASSRRSSTSSTGHLAESFRRRAEDENSISEHSEGTVVPLTSQQSDILVRHAIEWCMLHGLHLNYGDRSKPSFQHAPFSLLPTPFPSILLDEAVRINLKVNQLLHNFQNMDYAFLVQTLQCVSTRDAFIAKLLRIARAVRNEGPAQNISLVIHRTDHVLHLPTAANHPLLRISSLQTTGVAFAAFGSVVTNLHSHLINRYPRDVRLKQKSIPTNNCLNNIVEIFARTVSTYCSQFGVAIGSTAVLVVEDSIDDPSLMEWCLIEELLWDKFHINVLRRSLGELYAEVEGLKDGRALAMDKLEIALVYFRYGFKPEDYLSASEWSARLLLERCRAIKCPSIVGQLVGHRQVLHTLSRPEVIDELLVDPVEFKQAFEGWHPIPRTEEEIAIAASAPEGYLLQSSVNNTVELLSGSDLTEAIARLDPQDLEMYCLQERPRPPMQRNYCVQAGKVRLGNVVSELGVFGAILSDHTRVLHSSVLGHTLRSKMTDEDGGMSEEGLSVLDSPYLVQWRGVK